MNWKNGNLSVYIIFANTLLFEKKYLFSKKQEKNIIIQTKFKTQYNILFLFNIYSFWIQHYFSSKIKIKDYLDLLLTFDLLFYFYFKNNQRKWEGEK